jgi:hypothetical protein
MIIYYHGNKQTSDYKMTTPIIKCFLEVPYTQCKDIFSKVYIGDRKDILGIQTEFKLHVYTGRKHYYKNIEQEINKLETYPIWLFRFESEDIKNLPCHGKVNEVEKLKESEYWMDREECESLVRPHIHRKDCCFKRLLKDVIKGIHPRYHPREIWIYDITMDDIRKFLEVIEYTGNMDIIQTSYSDREVYDPDKDVNSNNYISENKN